MEVMKIAFDAKRAFRNGSGLGNYSRTLVDALQKYFPENRLELFSSKPPLPQYEAFARRYQMVLPSGIWKAAPALWRSYGMASAVDADIFHGLSNELPLLKVGSNKWVVTIHDLIFLKHTEQYPFADRKIYEWKTRRACELADHIVATSGETAADIIRFYGVKKDKISVVHQSCDPRFFQNENEATLAALRMRCELPNRFILNVGSFYPRKNQIKLIEAFEIIASDWPGHLVLIGAEGSMKNAVLRRISQSLFADRIHVKNVTDRDLAGCYQLATAFVNPSLYEGFGIPLTEAMASGTPLLAADLSCFREVADTAALYFDPNDATAIATQLKKVVNDDHLREEMRKKGSDRAGQFTAEKFAQAMMEVYKQLMR